MSTVQESVTQTSSLGTVRETVPQVPATAGARDLSPAATASIARQQQKTAQTISRVASLVALALMLLAPMFVRHFVVFQFTQIIIYGIAIMSLNILTGASGQFSLGHSAFFAVGAYTTAILMEHGGMNYILTLPFAGCVCFVFGFLFGLPALRLSGVYLALATFSLAIAMPQFLKLGTFEHFTGGVQGLVVTKPDAPFGLKIDQDVWLYYVTLAVALIMYVLSVNLLNSRTGRAMMAIRDNQIAASSMGVNLALYKTLSFGISAGMTGVAGGLAAIVVAFVAPDGYSITFANALFLGMVIGGVGWLPGSLAGAAFIVLIPNVAESVSKGLAGAVFGVFIIAVIFLFPNGARQAAYLAANWIRRMVGSTR
jgi:branched-chain amino acid transport system permease protein